MKAYLPEFRIEKLLLDSAHDAYAVYEYCCREKITPFIDLSPGHTGHFTYKNDFTIDDDTGVQRLTGNVAVSVNIPVRQQNTAEPCTSLPMIIQGCLTYRQETQKHGKRNTIEELPWNALISVRKKTIN